MIYGKPFTESATILVADLATKSANGTVYPFHVRFLWRAGLRRCRYGFSKFGTGSNPKTILIVDDSGNLYVTIAAGGVYRSSTVFESTP